MASTDAKPVPVKNSAYRITFPIYKADGTLITGAAGLDSEVSKDAGTAVDCTNEATEIATATGLYYLDLTSSEMNADCVAIKVKSSTTDAVPQVFVLYPQETGDIKVDVQSNAGTAITSAAGVQEVKVASIAANAITAAATATDFGDEIANAVWDEVVDGTYSARELYRVFAAVLGGQANGLGSSTAVYKNRDGSKTRITATVDADGNRSSVTFTDLT